MSLNFRKEFTGAFILSLAILFFLVIIFIPLDQFIELPDFLWFLENKSLLIYFNEHIDFFFNLIPLAGLVLLVILVVKK